MRAFTVACVLCGLLPVARAGTPLPDGPHVVVSGTGKSSVAPDLARVTLGVEARDADAATAKMKADRAVNGFLEVLRQAHVSAADVSADSLDLREDYDWKNTERILRGYLASRRVTVKLRDLRHVGDITDGGLHAGMTSIDGLAFESTQEDTLRQQARERAAADSRAHGEALARAYGASLGKIYSINSAGSELMNRYGNLETITVSGSRAPPPPPPPASIGEYLAPRIDYTERVQVVFELAR